jgi:hypothetical protein
MLEQYSLAINLVIIYIVGVLPTSLLCFKTNKAINPKSKGSPVYFIPLYSLCCVRQLYNGKPAYLTMFINALFLTMAVWRVFLVYTQDDEGLFLALTSLGIIITFFAVWLCHTITAIQICRLMRCGGLMYLASVLVPPVAFYVQSLLANRFFRTVRSDLDGTFGNES